jgi:hypothetical protein
MAEVLIFAKIFWPLYLKNYKGDNVDFFYGKPLWHEEDLVKIPRTWGHGFSLYNFFQSCPYCATIGAKWWFAPPWPSNTSFHVNRLIACRDIAFFSSRICSYILLQTIEWIGFQLLGQLHMVMLHLACEFHDAGLIRCEMTELMIFSEIFRHLYFENYKSNNVAIFYGKSLWHEEALVTIPRTWCCACSFRIMPFFEEVCKFVRK